MNAKIPLIFYQKTTVTVLTSNFRSIGRTQIFGINVKIIEIENALAKPENKKPDQDKISCKICR